MLFQKYGFCFMLLICSLNRSMGGQTEDGYVWHDDPVKHIQGVTYEKLQEFFQIYPMDRHNMDGYWWLEGSMLCNKFNGRREVKHQDTNGVSKSTSTICSSNLNNCWNVPTESTKMGFCPSAAKDRMYDYMETQPRHIEKEVYGRNYRTCELQTYDSGLGGSICLCDCENSKREVDRYFSLRDVLADDDKVVTGVRIKKINHVFYIQIQQGTLGPNSTIVGKPEWKAVEEISTYELEYNSKLTIQKNGDVDLEFKKNYAVYAITNKQRVIYLDNLDAGPGMVVTGLKLQQIDDDLRLKILATPYSTRFGELQSLASQWIVNKTDRSQRKSVRIEKAGIPTEHTQTTSISDANEFIQFQTSDFKDDLGQTTVPFIDTQDVVADPPSPLRGIGIFHKGNKDSAGFIALRGKYNKAL